MKGTQASVIIFLALVLFPLATVHADWCARVEEDDVEREICGDDLEECQATSRAECLGEGCNFLQFCQEQTSTDNDALLENPLQGTNTVFQFFEKFIDALVLLAIPVIVLFIILAGFKFVTAGGSQEKLKGAKKMITYVVIGTIIILAARILTSILMATVTSVRG